MQILIPGPFVDGKERDYSLHLSVPPSPLAAVLGPVTGPLHMLCLLLGYVLPFLCFVTYVL